MNYWIIRYTQLYKEPEVSPKICDIPARTIVEFAGEIENNFYKVQYRDFIGWVWAGHIEMYVTHLPEDVVKINNPTPNKYDAAQYIIYNGTTQYNLCGEMCISYIFGDSIDNFLEVWKAKPNSFWKRVFGTGLARGTSADELRDMANVYAGSQTTYIQTALYDSMSKSAILSPGRLNKLLLDGWKYIASVKISGQTGELQPTGVLHWVCVNKIVPSSFGGQIELYNPFPNAIEQYSWKEFTQSAGNPYGLLVKRV